MSHFTGKVRSFKGWGDWVLVDGQFWHLDEWRQYVALCRQERRLYLWGGLFSVVGFLFLAFMAFWG